MSETGMPQPDVIEEVLADHQQITWYLDRVESETGDRKAEAFGQLAQYLAMHESAEQAVVHPQMERLDDDVAEGRLEEESEGDQMLARLKSLDVDDPEFDALFAKFKAAVLSHAEHEEREEHPKLRAELGEDRLAELGGDFRAAEQDAAIGE
jgi:hemerythrin superfamily protein